MRTTTATGCRFTRMVQSWGEGAAPYELDGEALERGVPVPRHWQLRSGQGPERPLDLCPIVFEEGRLQVWDAGPHTPTYTTDGAIPGRIYLVVRVWPRGHADFMATFIARIADDDTRELQRAIHCCRSLANASAAALIP